MPLVVPQTTTTDKLKNFNGLRRTREGMLYLTSIDRQNSTDEITISTHTEDGKSDLVPNDGQTNYVDERLEMINVQTFTGDGSDKTFTLNVNMGTLGNRLAVFVDGVRQDLNTHYTVSNTTLTFVMAPHNGKVIEVAQINKRYKNNDSDKYQQFTFDTDATYLINSSADLVKRENKTVSRTKLSSDDFDTFESTTASVNSTTYQDAV